MNAQRIAALVSRNMKLNYRGLDPLTDVFYWPLFDILLWGLTSRFMQQSGSEMMLLWLSGLIFWHICVRANLDICLGFLTELWSRNVVNLFATPLELSDWIVGSMILGLIDGVVTLIYGALLIALFYGINIFTLGWIIVPLFFLLVVAGWTIGFFSASWLVHSGQSKQKIIWVLAWFFLPFSAVFYPLELLPRWLSTLAAMLPTAHAFEGLRAYVKTGIFPTTILFVASALSIVYLVISLIHFRYRFYQSCTKGLARLENE